MFLICRINTLIYFKLIFREEYAEKIFYEYKRSELFFIFFLAGARNRFVFLVLMLGGTTGRQNQEHNQ